MNLPNKLTLTRIALVPFFIACFYMSTPYKNLIAAVVFTFAYLTDVFDGQIARKHNLITNFGKLMDPIADKLLTCSAFIMLVSFGMLSPIAAIIVISREFIISGFRLVAAGSGNVIAASWLGKTKTVSQFVAIDRSTGRNTRADISALKAVCRERIVHRHWAHANTYG